MTAPALHDSEVWRARNGEPDAAPRPWWSPLAVSCPVGAAVVYNCRTDTPPASWPPVQVLALFPPQQLGSVPALERSAQRRLARQVMLRQFGAAAASHWLQLPREARGARRVSLSHEPGASLLAWCPSGAIGVDLVDLDHLAMASQQDLTATAALYLGPDGAAAVAAAPLACEARLAFALRWSSLEAKLKCLGLELDEWQPEVDIKLGDFGVVPVCVVDRDGQASRRWIGCVAWRDNVKPPSSPQKTGNPAVE